VPVTHTRGIGKGEMRNITALPQMEVDSETYEIFADGCCSSVNPQNAFQGQLLAASTHQRCKRSKGGHIGQLCIEEFHSPIGRVPWRGVTPEARI
jgi:hypothetical protein